MKFARGNTHRTVAGVQTSESDNPDEKKASLRLRRRKKRKVCMPDTQGLFAGSDEMLEDSEGPNLMYRGNLLRFTRLTANGVEVKYGLENFERASICN